MHLLERDAVVLAAIGRFRMLTRPQVKRWLFPDVSEPVVTRFVKRMETAAYLGVSRIGGNGIQVFWLTRKGRDALVTRGVSAADLFPASGPAAAKDFEHTIAIGEAAVWLSVRDRAPDELLPAWALARYFGGTLDAIPDLLALWRSTSAGPACTLAIEVDLGTEPLRSVLLPKLVELSSVLHRWIPAGPLTILVLVAGSRRRDSLRLALGTLDREVVVEVAVEAFSR